MDTIQSYSCSAVRHKVDIKSQAARHHIEHQVRLRETRFRLRLELDTDRLAIPTIYAALGQDEDRNALIFDDVSQALDAGRAP